MTEVSRTASRGLWSATLALLTLASSVSAASQDRPISLVPPLSPLEPMHIPSAGGEVILTSRFDHEIYKEDHLSAVRRSGPWLHFSGVTVGAPGEMSIEAFRQRTRRAFSSLGLKLKEAGADFSDVSSVHTYHRWQSPRFPNSKAEHNAVYREVAAEFLHAPYPAWTAIGVSELYSDNAVLEIELIAYLGPSAFK